MPDPTPDAPCVSTDTDEDGELVTDPCGCVRGRSRCDGHPLRRWPAGLPMMTPDDLQAVSQAWLARPAPALVQLPDVPAFVTRAQVADLCRLLRLPVDDVVAVHLEPHAVEVEVYARHPVDGQRFLQPDGDDTATEKRIATHQLVIPMVELPPAEPTIVNYGTCARCDRGGIALDDAGRLTRHESRRDRPCAGSYTAPHRTSAG